MYNGTTELTIDVKGRIAIPARYRASLSEKFGGRLTVTLGLDPCLELYPPPAWEAFSQKLLALPSLTPQNKALQRHFLGAAEETAMDRQGRLQLTPYLRERAGLDRAAIFVGQGAKFELWDKASWERYQQEVELDADFLASLGI